MSTTPLTRSSSIVIVVSAGLFWGACAAGPSGAVDPESADGGSDSASGSSGSSGSTGVEGGAEGSVDGSSGGTDASHDGATPLADAAPDGAKPLTDAGPGGTTTSLTCGLSTCALPSQLCCIVGPVLNPTSACATGNTCPIVNPGPTPGSAAITCTGAGNCGSGLSCCLNVVAGQAVSTCQATCAGAQLCDILSVNSGCTPQKPCSQSHINEFGLPLSFATCGGVKN